MKKFLKNQKGITLIALIITIVILVILAAVSIRAVTNMEIVGQATNGVQEYTQKSVEENIIMDRAGNLIDKTVENINDIQKETVADSFNNSNPKAAASVTMGSSFGDYGIQEEDRTEYYSNLININASLINSTIIGNAKANTFNIVGGTQNILTGGIGTDTYIFESGGGIITDFGIGSTKDVAGNSYATSTTNSSYDRTNPLTYQEGNDVLKLNGTVTKILCEGYNNSSTKK